VIQPVDVALRDGSTVRVREVEAADVDGLRQLLGGMSENSRWLRFLSSGVDLDRMASAAALARWASSVVASPLPCHAPSTANATSATSGPLRA